MRRRGIDESGTCFNIIVFGFVFSFLCGCDHSRRPRAQTGTNHGDKAAATGIHLPTINQLFQEMSWNISGDTLFLSVLLTSIQSSPSCSQETLSLAFPRWKQTASLAPSERDDHSEPQSTRFGNVRTGLSLETVFMFNFCVDWANCIQPLSQPSPSYKLRGTCADLL